MEDLGQLLREIFDLPAEMASFTKRIEDVDIAARPLSPTSNRPEEKQLGDPVARADVGEPSFVDGYSRDLDHTVRIPDRVGSAR